MTAKEMFEKLGYRYKESMSFVEYELSEEDYFVFYKLTKQIIIGNYLIGMDELKAINQQVKELGWIE